MAEAVVEWRAKVVQCFYGQTLNVRSKGELRDGRSNKMLRNLMGLVLLRWPLYRQLDLYYFQYKELLTAAEHHCNQLAL